MSQTIRIGTRDSELALWQAHYVEAALNNLKYKTALVPVKSQGDLQLDVPLYEMGITGIFTKTLDVALIKNQIDIAVHSLKDVPTQLPHGMIQAAVLSRASHDDILVYKQDFNLDGATTIATGSLRRKAQWLQSYPDHTVEDIRGNVNTRLEKLFHSKTWSAAIFARAGLERIGLLEKLMPAYGFTYNTLDSFIPAPAQGVMMVAAMEKNTAVVEALARLNHLPTQICTDIERQFLRALEGGCTAPIGAIAQITDNTLYFKGCLHSLNGKKVLAVQDTIKLEDLNTTDHRTAYAQKLASQILNKGGKELMMQIKTQLD